MSTGAICPPTKPTIPKIPPIIRLPNMNKNEKFQIIWIIIFKNPNLKNTKRTDSKIIIADIAVKNPKTTLNTKTIYFEIVSCISTKFVAILSDILSMRSPRSFTLCEAELRSVERSSALLILSNGSFKSL